MKKIISTSLLLVLTVTNLLGQQKGVVKGRLIDESTKDGIVGAVIQLSPTKTPAKKRFTTSAYKGDVSMSGIDYGNYDLTITFLGYDTIRRTINVNRPEVRLDSLIMRQVSQRIDNVVLEAQTIRTSQKGDTVIYNADAFKVSKDANAEGLLAKMPGVTVTNGKVEAQGEQVKKVFVDGKEFFGEDVTTAIKNIPAEMVSKVQVYNKLSDNAEFTGMDDGDGYKAINIVTTSGMSRGQFGKIYGGYGFNDKYQAGANLSYFTPNHRVTFIGMSNNVNMQNFSFEDILGAMNTGGGSGRSSRRGMSRDIGNFMVGPQSGVSKVNAFGLNYSGTWAKKLQVSGSYFFNTSRNTNDETTDRQYITDNTTTQRLYNADDYSSSRNYNHRINAKFDYKINDNHSLMMRPSLSFQDNSSLSNKLGLDSEMANDLNSLLNKEVNSSDVESNGYNISNSLLYRAKLGKPGRTITLDIRGSLSRNDRTSYSSLESFRAINGTLPTVADSTRNQQVFNNSNGYRIDAGATYTEPLTQYSQLNLQYRYSYRYSDADKKTYLWEKELNMFNPEYDPEYSNIYNSGYTTHRVGPGYNYSNKKTTISANVSYQRSSLDNEQEVPIITPAKSKYEFNNIVYFAMLNKPFNSTNTLRMFLRSYTDNPSVSQLQDVLNLNNLKNVSTGNPSLKPTYNHNLYTTYVRSSITKGRTFMAMIRATIERNTIADSTVLLLNADDSFTLPNGVELGKFGQFSKPINMNGKWETGVMLNYGTPIKLIKSNFNINVGANYSESPSIINGLENRAHEMKYNAGASLGSNINENIDFTLSYNGGYNITNYKINLQSNKTNNEYLTQSAALNFKIVFWKGFTFSGTTTYSQYKGVTDNFNEQYVFCNLYVGKKLFRNQRGEIIFGVNDLLNQTETFTRNIAATYIENVKNNAIGRYFGLQFVYNLKNFKGKNNSGSNDTPPSERRMMPPPGGMRPPGGGGMPLMH